MMVDRLIGLAILALRPFEMYHEWRVKRDYRKGRYRRPADIGAGAVTTRRAR